VFFFAPQIPTFLMSQVRKMNENSNRRYQFYDRRIKNLLRKIHSDARDKPDKNTAEVRPPDPQPSPAHRHPSGSRSNLFSKNVPPQKIASQPRTRFTSTNHFRDRGKYSNI